MASTRQAIVCFLLVAGITVCGYSQTAPEKNLNATISGKVTVSGNAVSGVVITLREATSSRKLLDQRGLTDSNGEYRITNVPPGNYSVAPAAGAFVAASASTVERSVIVNQGETIKDLDFSLMTGGVITGKVVDPDGRPIIEEEIQVFSGANWNKLSPYAAAVTDDRGVYRIFGLKPGSYKVAAGREGDPGTSLSPGPHVRTFYPAVTELSEATVIQVAEGTEAAKIDITLSRALTTYKVTGRILSGDTGDPLPNVNYGFKRADSTFGSRNFGALTDERGEFKLENMPPGQYALVVGQQPGSYFRAKDVPFEVIDHDVTGIEVTTLKSASLSGVMILDGTHDKEVREQFLKTSVFAMVENESTRTTAILGVEGKLSPNGSFRIGGLPAGTATFSLGVHPFTILRVEQSGIAQVRGVELKEGEDVAGIRIVVGYKDAVLSGTVVLENGPVPPGGRLSVIARRLNDPFARTGATADVDARGQFLFDALFPGTYEVTAAVFLPNARGPLAQAKQQVVVISGSTGKITIRLDLNPPKPNQ